MIGAGVSGLTTAVRLLERGHSVRIVSRARPLETTSAIAAAIWFPYAEQRPEEAVRRWGLRTYDALRRLAEVEGAGVSMVDLLVLWREGVERGWEDSIPATAVRPASDDELPQSFGMGWVTTVPLAEAPIYLEWLLQRFEALGGVLQEREVMEPSEARRGDEVVINCAGLGARELVGDRSVKPIRGQVVRVRKPHWHGAWVHYLEPGRLAHVFPRSCDMILGGTMREADDLEPSERETEEILARCQALDPRLDSLEVEGVAVGLRPDRTVVRCEYDEPLDVVHNYGHGGTGFTLSWGCADEVTRIVEGLG